MTNEYILPRGFKSAGIKGGIKKDKLDTALIVSDSPCVTTGYFTTNRLKSAHIIRDKKLLKNPINAVYVNSGNANVFTGKKGVLDIAAIAAKLGKESGIKPGNILFAATGIIGKKLPVDTMLAATPSLLLSLSEKDRNFPKAIMTTDAFQKTRTEVIKIGGKKVTICGAGKGAGMISPDMATLLVFVMTDAAISRKMLDLAGREAVGLTFNRITVDGDMSPNDTVLCLANGAAGNKIIQKNGKEYRVFAEALLKVMRGIAEDMVLDGEGATKMIRINIKGAKNISEAKKAALEIANSQLCKTAFFGQSLNMGRIISAIGASKAKCDLSKVAVKINGITAVKSGELITGPKLASQLKERKINLDIDFADGRAEYFILTTDLSFDYVKINADYS